MNAEKILLQLQQSQQAHDERSHRDILGLDTHTRLKHMILHFLKYAGKITNAGETGNHELLKATLVDTFIICLAMANTLNTSIGANIHEEAAELDDLAKMLGRQIAAPNIFDFTLKKLVSLSGKMAKSIESTDHLERGNPREELETLIVELSISILQIIGVLGFSLNTLIHERWAGVEQKLLFNKLSALQ
ncbi:hypothetical protein ACO0LG_05025 [Undibacterium sp. Ji42W]|uniref:hypothetical protein n=1 Tax=Undibacterium sp. Ji42W TaxID=3413039 RepID=UPI003BF0624D